jgi:hypothetical protein
MCLDSLLEPIYLIACAGGPINSIPSFFKLLTKSPFSDKNPYPGCIASAPVFLAISMIF